MEMLMKARHTLLAVLVFVAAGQAFAVRVENAPPPSPDAVLKQSSSASSAHADDSSSLREGVITDVSEKRDQVQINGSWLQVVNGKTRVFRGGRSANAADELVKGKRVKFTLSPGAPGAPGAAGSLTLGVVYVP